MFGREIRNLRTPYRAFRESIYNVRVLLLLQYPRKIQKADRFQVKVHADTATTICSVLGKATARKPNIRKIVQFSLYS